MTRGKPAKHIISFALPLMFSGALQLFYTFFDGLIVGRLLGTEAFAAVGASANVNWFPLSMITGAAQGFEVILAQRFGAKDMPEFRRAFAASVYLSLMLGAAFSALGISLSGALLSALSTPAELSGMAGAYLRMLWAGLPVSAVYNALACSLRAAGDSRTPLFALIMSTIINVALDYAFIAWFDMGVSGAALSTVIAQATACVPCALRLRAFKPHKNELAPRRKTLCELAAMGAPPMLSSGVISAGGLLVQESVNACGVSFVAGISAARRYYELMNVFGAAFEGALATFVGQNAGAKMVGRIKSGVKTALTLGGIAALITGTAVFAASGKLVGLYIGASDAEAVKVGVTALRIEAVFLISLYALCMCRAAAQAMGSALSPMICGFTELAVRIACVVMVYLTLERGWLYFTNAGGWLAAAVAAALLLKRAMRALKE